MSVIWRKLLCVSTAKGTEQCHVQNIDN